MGALDPVALSEQHELWLIKMKLVIAVLVLGFTLSNGAVLPTHGKLVKAVQSLIADPQALADTLSRVKRSANGKTVDLHIPGVDVELEYLDEVHKYKGGKLTVNLDLKKYFRYPPENIKSVKLVVKLDGGERLDGFFTLTVDYELHHFALEKGTFTFKTSRNGAGFKLLCSNSGNDDNYRLLSDFALELESDFSTSLSANLVDDGGYKYDFKVFRRPLEQLVISASSSLGHSYKVQADIDHQAKAVSVKLEQDGNQMLASRASFEFDTRRKAEIKSELSAKGLGKFDMRVTFTGPDSPTLEVESRYNDKVIVAAKGKVIIDKVPNKHLQYKTQLRYAGMGAVKEGKIQIKATRHLDEPTADIVFHYIPETGLDLKIEGVHEQNARSELKNVFKLKITRNEEVYVDFNLLTDLIDKRPSEQGLLVQTNLHVSDKSLLQCLLQCFNDRSLKASYTVGKKAPKMTFSLETNKDGKQDFFFEIDTVNNPYHITLFVPSLHRVPQKLVVDYSPNQHLIVKIEPAHFDSFFAITKKGNVYEVSVQGKKVAKGPITFGNNKFEADLVLFNNEPLKISLGWSGAPIMGKIKAKVQYGSLVDLQKVNIDYCFHYFVFKVDVQGTVMGKTLAVIVDDGKVNIDF